MAARAAAWRMADIVGEQVGGLVGWHVRLERKASPSTRVLVLTEGLLSRRILSDPELDGVGLVIFDEFHERSVHADFGLALALDVQRALRPDLRILVMSATLDADAIARHLAPDGSAATVIQAHGRMFPVETEFEPFAQEPNPARKTALGVRRALARHDGSVLAFLPGEGEIRSCAEALSAPGALPSDADLRPLYAALPRREQDLALAPPPAGRRKVVLATSIAESSLTIEGVSCVVDSGLARISRFSPDSGMSHLETIRISRDRADQRAGRAGRLCPGWCLRLWDEAADRRLARAAPPEILVADLAPFVLACADWGSSAPDSVPWPTPPPAATWRGAIALLRSLDALDSDGRITPHGRDLARFGAHPRLAQMMLAALDATPESTEEACLLAAALSEGLPASARPSSNAEHLVRDLQEGDGAVPPAARSRIRELARAWFAQLTRSRNKHVSVRDNDAFPHPTPSGLHQTSGVRSTGELLAMAYPDRLARRRRTASDEGRYLTIGGRGAKLPPGDPLARAEWIVVADIDEADADGAIRLAAPIDATAVMRLFGSRIVTESVVEWNDRAGRVDAVEREKLGAVVVRERPARDPDLDAVSRCLCLGLRSRGIAALGWTDASLALRARMSFLRRALPDEDWPDVSDEALSASLETWLGPRLVGCKTAAEASHADLCGALRDLAGQSRAREIDILAPERMEVATGSRVRIDYEGDVPAASVRLQECFGMTATPRVARGRVAVRMELLSPAQRPVQITDDLARFWREGYPLVRKELRGRYPRHFWPEDGASAIATRRCAPRR